MRDNSSVYHKSMLDDEFRVNFSDDKPWIFETAGDLITCATEEEACRVQRTYRSRLGFDPITGEQIKVFPIELQCSVDGQYPFRWLQTFLSAKSAGLVWFAYDVIIHSHVDVEFVVYDMFDSFRGGVGKEISRLNVKVTHSLTEPDVKRKIMQLAKDRRLRELQEEENKIINRYADDILASINTERKL